MATVSAEQLGGDFHHLGEGAETAVEGQEVVAAGGGDGDDDLAMFPVPPAVDGLTGSLVGCELSTFRPFRVVRSARKDPYAETEDGYRDVTPVIEEVKED